MADERKITRDAWEWGVVAASAMMLRNVGTEAERNRHLDERCGKVRKSLYVFGTWKRGKRRPARTVWQ